MGKVCFVDKSSPLRVLAQYQIRNVKWYLEMKKTHNKNIQHDAKSRFSEFV
jgi:hypothetical protein